MWRVALMIWLIAAPTLAGILVMAILTVPQWSAQATKWIPIASGLAAVVAIPVAMMVAKAVAGRRAA
ncbi:MAG: hypothetical protein KGL46_10750 [Hyphomicrobiales bacterium]|nr:hypothetical protein [Hyphomicrobiales bacterium]